MGLENLIYKNILIWYRLLTRHNTSNLMGFDSTDGDINKLMLVVARLRIQLSLLVIQFLK